MNQPSFNVLTQPWIPVIRINGEPDELGILPCLEQAHRLREIRDPAPIVEFGIYRLLIAFLLDALIHANQKPDDALDISDLIDAGHFEARLLENYVAVCGDVFDLFSPDKPFLQTAGITGEIKPVAGLYPAIPSGVNAIHWNHLPEEQGELTSTEAARLLTTIAPFMTAGGPGLSPSINGAPAIYALPMGDTLFETLALNIPLRSGAGDGAVAWRSNRIPGTERTLASMVEALTWQPRKIRFMPEADPNGMIRVRRMMFIKGDSTRLEWIDPNLAYRYGGDKTTPVRLRENRPLWREAGPLALLNRNSYGTGEEKIAYARPDVVESAYLIRPRDAPLTINAYAMRTDMKKKVFEWVKSTLFIPAGLGKSTRIGATLFEELARAEKAASALRFIIRQLFPRKGAKKGDALANLADRSERAYWQRLEGEFEVLMRAFAGQDEEALMNNSENVAALTAAWRNTIREQASEQFESAAADMDADGDALERQVHARNSLYAKIGGILK